MSAVSFLQAGCLSCTANVAASLHNLSFPLLIIISTILLVALTASGVPVSHADHYKPIPPNQLYIQAPSMSVHTEDTVDIRDGATYTTTHIWGTVIDHPTSLHIHITGPDGSTQMHSVNPATERYEVYHMILGDHRHLEGEYQVRVDANYTNNIRAVGTAAFYVDVLSYEPPDVTIRLDDAMALPDCRHDAGCPGQRSYTIPEGGTVDWENAGTIPHHIYSVAEGYGSQDPEFIDEPGPNAFRGKVIESGDAMRVPFDHPGTVLFSCLFHPWIEGLVVVESQDPSVPDGGDIQNPPVSVLDIVDDEIPPEGDVDHPPVDIADNSYILGDEKIGLLDERAELEEARRELIRLETERVKAEIAAEIAAIEYLETMGSQYHMPGIESLGEIRITVLESPVDLWGGTINARILVDDMPADEFLVTLYGPDGHEVHRTYLYDDSISIPVQPTWTVGAYTISVSDGLRYGNTIVDIAPSAESCIGDRTYDGRLLCLAGTVEESTDSHVQVNGVGFVPAGLGPSIILSDICYEGAVATIDVDPNLGRNAASIWCDGTNVNRIMADAAPDLVLDSTCMAERPLVDCPSGMMLDAILDDIVEAAAGDGAEDDMQTDRQHDDAMPDDAQPDDTPDDDILGSLLSIGGDCPIALLSYGTTLAEPVQTLREYRSGLAESGHAWMLDGVHTAYYAISPYITDVLRSNALLADAARMYIAPYLVGAASFVQ